MKTALVIIDVQNDYFPGGKRELSHPVEAAEQASLVLAFFREKGWPVFHVQHVHVKPGATTMLPGTWGVEIHAKVRPIAGEKVVVKHFPNSFRETELLDCLKEREVERLVICGMQTNMCVDATTRAATDLGYPCLVAGDACAARDLEWDGITVPAAQVHTAFLGALNGSYGRVLRVEELLYELQGEG